MSCSNPHTCPSWQQSNLEILSRVDMSALVDYTIKSISSDESYDDDRTATTAD
jgi:hypothetical protein